MKEIFKDIKGYEGLYKVSNLGNVSSQRGGKVRILSTRLDTKGYLAVNLSKNGKMKTHRLHRLVAIAFIANPENKLEVNHENGVKTDNRVENLSWVTGRDNIIHARKNGLYKHKINMDIAIEIRKIKNKTYAQMATMYGVSKHIIKSVRTNRTWKNYYLN